RNSPDCELLMAAGEADRDRMRAFQGEINRVVRDAAERNGATVVIPDEPGHSMCAPAAARWVDLAGLQTGAAPVHPTAAGHAQVGERGREAPDAGYSRNRRTWHERTSRGALCEDAHSTPAPLPSPHHPRPGRDGRTGRGPGGERPLDPRGRRRDHRL